MDVSSCISYRSFASRMGDSRFLHQVDTYIQEHLVQVAEEEEFLKLPRLKVCAIPSAGSLGFREHGVIGSLFMRDISISSLVAGGAPRRQCLPAQQRQSVHKGNRLGAAQHLGARRQPGGPDGRGERWGGGPHPAYVVWLSCDTVPLSPCI